MVIGLSVSGDPGGIKRHHRRLPRAGALRHPLVAFDERSREEGDLDGVGVVDDVEECAVAGGLAPWA
jgi:hypothetical protein